MDKESTPLFKGKIRAIGGSKGTIIREELISFIEAIEGTELALAAFKGKHGKYIAIWKEEEEKKGD